MIGIEPVLWIGISQSFFAGLLLSTKRPFTTANRLMAAWLFLICIELSFALISNSDLTSPPLSDFINKHLAGSGTDSMWIIESTPLNEAIAVDYGFSRKVSYIDKDSYRITKIEFCNFDNQVFKVLEVKGVHPLPGGKYMIKDMIASNLQNNRKSEIVFNNIRDGVAIDDSFFSVQNLER